MTRPSPSPEAPCDLCVGECHGHSPGHPEQWIPEPGSRASPVTDDALWLLHLPACHPPKEGWTDDDRERLKNIAAKLAASDRDVLVGAPTDAMIEAGRAEAFNQAHRTYGDMCRAIYLAMRDAALIPLAGEL